VAESFLCGLIGARIQGSRSPALHQAEARAQGLALTYKLIDLDVLGVGVEALPRLLDDAVREGYCGLNITFPCKQAVMPLLQGVSEEARAIGAVNTIVIAGGKRTGYNTDGRVGMGFRRALPDADLARVVLLGAGGAGSACADAVLRLGVRELVIVDRETARAGDLARRMNAIHGQRCSPAAEIEAALRGATGLIHATPTGMAGIPGMPLQASLLTPRLWGVGHRLRAARDGIAQGRQARRMPDHGRRPHERRPGARRVSLLHRPRCRPGAHGRAFPVAMKRDIASPR